MQSDWDAAADAWIAAMGADGEPGDWARRHILDPAMLERIETGRATCSLDVGCGEGRFCRKLASLGMVTVGLDPTERLVAEARRRDPEGAYVIGNAEQLPFADASFDLVVSYLTLIDIPDFRRAIIEMARVLRPGGRLLIANLNGFVSSVPNGWVTAGDGTLSHYAVDRYMEEFPAEVRFSGMRVINWHRPISAYMQALLASGLRLEHFDEPVPRSGDERERLKYCRAPWFHVMEWRRPGTCAER